jgi:hypothetical protein
MRELTRPDADDDGASPSRVSAIRVPEITPWGEGILKK